MVDHEEEIDEAIVAMSNPDSAVRRSAVETLSAVQDERAKNALIAALKDEDVQIAWAAIQGLTRIADWDAIIALMQATADDFVPPKNPGNWHSAILLSSALDALRKIGEPAVRPLIMALNDPAWIWFRYKAADLLGEIGDERAILPLLTALGDTDTDDEFAINWALERLGYR